MSKKIQLVNPEAPAPATATAAAERDIRKSGVRLGVLDNSKGNADHLLKFLVEGIKAALPVAAVLALRKDSVSLPAPRDILDRFAAESDFVVTAMAD